MEAQTAEPLNLEVLSERKLGDEKPNLDGRQVTIKDVSLLPKTESHKTQNGKHTYRDVLTRLVYKVGDAEVFEHLGGVKQFEHDGQWGGPTFLRGGSSQVANLFRLWLSKKGVQPKHVSLKGFLRGLVGMECVLSCRRVSFQGEEFRKNLVEVFV